MNFRPYFAVLAFVAVALCMAQVLAAKPLVVLASIAPQKYFIEQVGGDLVKVEVMVPPGTNPHFYEPKPRQMVTLSRAKAYFAVGVGFEAVWLPRFVAANPKMKLVLTDAGINKRPMSASPLVQRPHYEDEAGKKHKRNPDQSEHSHGALDPHVWLAPALVKKQAGHILKGLTAIDKTNRPVYEANYRRFVKEIDALDHELESIFDGRRGLAFMVMHPSWGYFADAYGLVQVPIEIEGKAPKPAQLKTLIEQARKRNIKVIFVQPQFSTTSAATIARAIGGKVIFADPLAADWAANLRRQADLFKAALK